MTDTIPLSTDCDRSLISALLSTVPLRLDIHTFRRPCTLPPDLIPQKVLFSKSRQDTLLECRLASLDPRQLSKKPSGIPLMGFQQRADLMQGSQDNL